MVAIRSFQGSGDTLSLVEGVNSDVNKCDRCDKPADGEASPDLCTEHRKDQRRRQRESMQRKRDEWDAAGKCTRCGGVRFRDRKWCRMCLLGRGLVDPSVLNNDVNNGRWAEVVEQSPDGVPRARRRFAGQGKRGRRSIESMDTEDLAEAFRDLSHGIDGMKHAASDEVQQKPKIQRDDVKDQALAKLVSAGRWIVEVIKRHGYEIPFDVAVDEGNEDE